MTPSLRTSRATPGVDCRHLLALCSFGALAFASLSCGGKDGGTGPKTPNPPAAMQVVSGDQQQGVVGTELPAPIVAKVVDKNGQPVAGQIVNFVVTGGGGHVFAGSSVSNASGIVQERWTLGTSTAQAQTLEARAVDSQTGAPLVFGTFTATVLAGPAHDVVLVSGDAQTAAAGTALTDSIAAKVEDQYGNPVAGATVQWALTAGGGSVSPTSATSGANGIVRTRLTLGAKPGANAGTATVAGLTPATFSAMAVAGAPASLVIVSGDGQTASVGSALANPLSVRALDAFGNPVGGASVTWATTGGGSFDPPTSTTSADGLASARWSLGTRPGSQTATASITGAGSASFSATAVTGPATSVAIVSGDGQSARVGTAVANPLVVKLTDEHGNPVSGTTVRWAPTTTGTQVSPADAVTNADGVASTQLTLRTTSGSNSATATVAGLTPVSFTATGVPGDATRIETYGTNAPSATVASTVQVSVRAFDQFGNAVGGTAIDWAVTAGGGSFAESRTTTAANNGVAIGTWRLGTQTGPSAATATMVTGGSTVTFTVQASAGPAQSLEKVSGDAQSAQVPATLPESLVVRARDQYGNLATGAMVTWDGGTRGNISPVNATVDVNGLARAQWTLSQPGQDSATASAGGARAIFTATGAAASGPTLTIVSGNGQTAIVMDYLQDLIVQLNDASGRPVPGARLSWTPSRTMSSYRLSDVTDSLGRGTAHIQGPGDAGVFTLSVVANYTTGNYYNTVGPATFSENIVAGPWCKSNVTYSGPGTASPGGTVTVLLHALDWAGNAASGATVGDRLTVGGGGTVTWHDSIPGLSVGTWVLGSNIGTQTLQYQETDCSNTGLPSANYPKPIAAYDVININVVQPQP